MERTVFYIDLYRENFASVNLSTTTFTIRLVKQVGYRYITQIKAITFTSSYIALGNLSQAAIVLGKSSSEESLSLAADIAKVIGQTTFAGHIEEKRELLKSKNVQTGKPEELEELPSKVEALVKGDSEAKDEDDEKDGKTEKSLPSSKEDAFMKGDSNVNNEDGQQGNIIEEKLHSNGDLNENNGGIQQDDKTKELLEELHSKMEELMKENLNVEEKEICEE